MTTQIAPDQQISEWGCERLDVDADRSVRGKFGSGRRVQNLQGDNVDELRVMDAPLGVALRREMSTVDTAVRE